MKFQITTEDKPHLRKAMAEEPEMAKEVISTFAALMDEAFNPDKGVRWADLPKEFFDGLTFRQLIRGVLRGALDVKQINPEAYDVLKAEVHPLSILKPRRNMLDDGIRYTDWRKHFGLDSKAQVNEETIARIIQNILRHSRYVRIDQLREALEYNQVATFRGLGEQQVEKLPFYPALRHQRINFGDLHVGKFFEDNGFLDCGTIAKTAEVCTACRRPDLYRIDDRYIGCLACNAGYVAVDPI